MKANDERIVTFVQRLGQLSPGDRARLKRSAGKSMAEAPGVMGIFFRTLPHGIGKYDEPWFFLVATLFPLAAPTEKGNLGDALHHLRTQENEKSQGLDRRFEVLLDASPEQIPYYLRQMVRMLAARDVPLNWAELLADLTRWNHADRFVQTKWARSYFARPDHQMNDTPLPLTTTEED